MKTYLIAFQLLNQQGFGREMIKQALQFDREQAGLQIASFDVQKKVQILFNLVNYFIRLSDTNAECISASEFKNIAQNVSKQIKTC